VNSTRDFPPAPVRLSAQILGGVARAVRRGVACIGVGSLLRTDMTGFRRTVIQGVQIIPAAASDQPLTNTTARSAVASASVYSIAAFRAPDFSAHRRIVLWLTTPVARESSTTRQRDSPGMALGMRSS
jgi:hypothetical protein